MSKKIINYVSLRNGRCGLTIDSPAAVLKREGTANVKYVRTATAKEVAWVRSMGGEVPEGRIAADAEGGAA